MTSSTGTFLLLLLILQWMIAPTNCACPTIFFAEAISQNRMNSLSFYYTKSSVPSSADCANLCGSRQFCRTAIYNHDSHTCAFSYEKYTECSIHRQRYNTFHLTADGADSLSVITCIDPCPKQQGREEFLLLADDQPAAQQRTIHPTPLGTKALFSTSSAEQQQEQQRTVVGSRIQVEKEKGKEVTFKAKQLHLQEEFGGASSSAQQANKNNRIRMIQRNGSESRVDVGGFTKKLKPGEKLGESGESGEGGVGRWFGSRWQTEIRKGRWFGSLLMPPPNLEDLIPLLVLPLLGNDTHSLPVQLITMSPPPLKTINAATKINVHPQQSPELAELNQQIGEMTPHLEPIVINGRVLSKQEAEVLLIKESTSTTTTTTTAPWKPAGLIGEGDVEEGPEKIQKNRKGDGFLNTFVIHGLSSMFNKEEEEEASADGDVQKKDAPARAAAPLLKNSTTTPIVCYRSVAQQTLLNAGYKKKQGITLNQCRCACAHSWRNSSSPIRCKSLQYDESTQTCVLNRADHTTKYDLVFKREEDYHYVSCDIKYLLITADRMCSGNKKEGATPSPPPPPTTTTTAKLTIFGEEKGTTTTTSTPATTTTLIQKVDAPPPPEVIVVANRTLATPSLAAPLLPQPKKISTNLTMQSLPSPPKEDPPIIKPLLNVTINGCFEVIEGFAMNSTAGGLERDVSLEQCMCFCSNSLSSTRYPFQCTSASYYPKERDCVLNVDNRQLNEQYFVPTTTHSSTYLGLICPSERALQKHSQGKECGGVGVEPTPPPPPKSMHSDDCFVEMPNYVLEGTALAIETNTSAEECKCFCVDSEKRYGSECQSLQYYWDSQTCLLNKENRISDPDRFVHDPSSSGAGGVRHSYFDYRSGAALSTYVEKMCQGVVPTISLKDSTTTSTTVSPLLNIDDNQSNEIMMSASGRDRNGSVEAKKDRSTTTTTTPSPSPPIKVKKAGESTSQSITILKKNEKNKRKHTTTTTTTTIAPIPTTAMMSGEDSFMEEEERSEEKWPLSSASDEVLSKADAWEEKKFERDSVITAVANTTEGPAPMPVNGTVESPPPQQTNDTAIPEQEETEEEVDNDTGTSTPSKGKVRASTTTAHTSSSTTTSPSPITPKPFPYPLVGPCRYSALYQTVFNGGRLIKRLMVASPAQCFAACHAEKCRSANLIQMEGHLKYCELYRDSIVDFRRTDVLSADRGAVHFDSIQCEPMAN